MIRPQIRAITANLCRVINFVNLYSKYIVKIYFPIRTAWLSKQDFIATTVLCMTAVFYYMWSWSNVLAHFGGDNATYILTAKYFSPFSQQSTVSEFFAVNSQYPPLYPLLLGLSGSGESLLIAHIVTTTFLLLALLVIYKWILLIEFNKLHALIIIFIIAICPGTYIQALSLHSENLYLLFSISAIFFVSCYENNNNNKWLWFATIFIACASLTRSAGISLVISFIIYLVIKREKQRYLLSLIAIIPMIVWSYFNTQDGNSYLSALSGFYSTDFINTLHLQITNQSTFLLDAWFATFTYGIFGKLILSILAGICFLALNYRLYKKKLDGIYILVYLLMIIVWPYPAESMRLLFPIIPLLLVQTSILLQHSKILTYKNKYSVGNIVMAAILLIIIFPNLLLTINRFNTTIDEFLIPYKHTYVWYTPDYSSAIDGVKLNHVIISSITEAREYVPTDQCVYSIKPSVIGLYMERISRTVPDQNINDADFKNILNQSNCQYIYLMSIQSPSYEKPLYPLERIIDDMNILKIHYLDEQKKENPIAILGKLK